MIIGAGVALADRHAIGQAATDTVHVIETALFIAACVVGSAVVGGLAFVSVRWRIRARARTRGAALALPATVPARLVRVGRPAVSELRRTAITGPASRPLTRSAVPYGSPVSDSRVYDVTHD